MADTVDIKELKELTNPEAPVSERVFQPFYPLTHEKAVRDSQGNSLDSKLATINEGVQETIDEAMQELSGLASSLVEDYKPIVIEGDVTNAPDEEDLTSYNNGSQDVIRLKDKDYNSLIYSGLGRVYLRKNMDWLGYHFAEIIQSAASVSPTVLTTKPDSIVFETANHRFLAKKNTTFHSQWTYGNAAVYLIPEDDNVYVCEAAPANQQCFVWDDSTTDKLVSTTGEKANILTQSMMNKANTIYIIQYDYDLNGESIEVPEGCVLKFEGGSLGNGEVVFDSTFLSGEPILNVSISGTVRNDRILNTWFGITPNDTTTNNDDKWNRFIEASRVLGVTAYIIEGNYAVYSQLNITSKTVIVGADRLPILFYKGNSEGSLFYCTGSLIVIENLYIQRPIDIKRQGIGIRIGNKDSKVSCTSSVFRGIRCAWLYTGIIYEFCWNLDNSYIHSNYNVYGVLHYATECHIDHLVCEGNVVGVKVDKADDYNDPGLELHMGTVEGNGMGFIINCGHASLNGIYLEGNKPDSSNGATSEEYSSICGDYLDGCEVLCGHGNEYVKSLTILDCKVGVNDASYSSLFSIDKCCNLNIIGTLIRNLVTTSNTTISNSFSGNYYNLSQNGQRSPRIQSLANYKLSQIPSFVTTYFHTEQRDDLKRVRLGCGYAFTVTSSTDTNIADGICKLYVTDNTGYGQLYLSKGGNYSYNSKVTAFLSVRISNYIQRVRLNIDGTGDELVFSTYTNRNIPYLFPIGINEGLRFYCISGYTPNDVSNGISIEGIYIYEGTAYNPNLCNNFGKMWETATIMEAEKCLIIPNTSPSTHIYDLNPYTNTLPMLYFNNESKKLVIKDGTSHIDAQGNPADISKKGTFASRPTTNVPDGFEYYATDLHKPIYYSTSNSKWYDANGNEVEITKVATPVIEQTYANNAWYITMKCATPNAVIYYTTDGTTPTDSSTEYNGAFTASQNTVIKAIGHIPGKTDSDVTTFTVHP